MEYIIFLILGLIALSAFKKYPKRYLKNKKVRQEKVKIINRQENPKEIIFIIDAEDTFILTCKIKKDMPVWVSVVVNRFEDHIYEYNMLNFKWKNNDSPDIFEYQRAINKIIREEWNNEKEKHGWIFGKQEPKKKLPPVTVDISTNEIIIKYDPDKLKGLKENIDIQGSETEPYRVNLKTLSCTCQDFIKRRSGYPEGDIRRVCKHQAQAIINEKMNTKITDDKKIQAIIRNSQSNGFYVFEKCIEISFNEEISGPEKFHLFLEKDNDWLNVIVFTEKSFERSGYNINEKRWAYRNNPFPDGLKRKYVKAIQVALNIN